MFHPVRTEHLLAGASEAGPTPERVPVPRQLGCCKQQRRWKLQAAATMSTADAVGKQPESAHARCEVPKQGVQKATFQRAVGLCIEAQRAWCCHQTLLLETSRCAAEQAGRLKMSLAVLIFLMAALVSSLVALFSSMATSSGWLDLPIRQRE
ncbi:hypothetical protein F4780DRAFT_727854 [Xylariomycetidae sp. FL0641]|nr:hypothetical protein F4780DRAFT_727854 [Xylariomycetidae sp. FL0641]